jgi:adenylyltransferase/sulfurtransferase
LSSVGVEGQKRLKGSAVLLIGAGGLGSPVLLYLAAAGVGHIGIVDADTVDESNLQRQIVHGTSTLGMNKCESARRRMLDVNPHVQIRTYEEEFTSGSARRIVQDGFDSSTPYQVVVDGSDNFPTKYLINDACALEGLPWVYSAILGFEGQLSVFNFPPNVGPDYRDLLSVPPPPGDVPSCAEGGVLGVLPGTLGCLQAVECLKLLLGRTNGLCSGRVLVFDALRMKFSEVGLARSDDREPIWDLIDYQGFCGGPSAASSTSATQTVTAAAALAVDTGPAALPTMVRIKGTVTSATTSLMGHRSMDENSEESEVACTTPSPAGEPFVSRYHCISPGQCFDRLRSGWSPWVVDVRLSTEHDIVALPFTDRVVPHRQVSSRDIPKTGDVLVYCKGGVRSKKACETLAAQGIDPTRLYSLQGGILQWQKEVDPSMPRY